MKKLLVVISFLTLFMVAHATVKEVAIEYLTAEQVSPENDGLFGEVNPEQWRLYGGKELQTMNGLNLYDFHARWQDYATCWFTTQDPLAEKHYALSPYTYCTGNPIMFIDPTGKETKAFVDERYESDRFISLAAAKYPSNNDIQIFAHGNTDKIAIFIDGKTTIIKSHTELLGIINNHFTSGKTITSKTNRTIVLHSCKTGSGKNSVAQKISKEMPNATIIAPDGF